MRLRILSLLILITILSSLPIVLQSRTSTTITAFANQKTPPVKRKQIQPDLPGTVSGATNPEAIPDTVAFELFMRSISDYPSERVFGDTGLNDDGVKNAMSYLGSFELAMSLFDQGARTIKKSGNGTNKLAQLQKKKEEFLDRGLNHYLPMILGADGGSKIRSYINARVKSKTKKLPGNTAKRSVDPKLGESSKPQNSSVFRHHAALPVPVDGVYVYSNAWYDGENVYGSGTLSSDYNDFNQYLVTTTVVAPNGSRWSSSQTGWDYSAVTDTEYLPIWPNDGTFIVESVFEGTNGYVSSAMNAVTVAPQVSVSFAAAVPPLVSVGGSVDIVAQISFTQGVPSTATALVELNETININSVGYTLGSPTGGDVNSSNKRVVTVDALPAGVRTPNWSITQVTAGNGVFSFPGASSVTNVVRIDAVVPSPPVTIGTATMPTVFAVQGQSQGLQPHRPRQLHELSRGY